jgi:hypothetical protein
VTAPRSALLAAWSAAWFSGQVGPDEVIDAVTGADAAHRVSGLPSGDGLLDALVACRRAGTPPRVALPVPGDVRGVPGPAGLRAAAVEAGEAVVCAGLALVPSVVDYAPSSAPSTVTWAAWDAEPARPDHVQLSEASYDLVTAIRECAAALARAEVAGGADALGDALADARRAGERLHLPPGHPPRAVALLAQAERMHAVLQLAAPSPAGGAVDASGIAARSAALRPLETAVRRARVAGYNAGADMLG